MGPNYRDDPGKKLLRRDYGLVELSFSDVDGPMSCFGISVQVHRLVHGHCVPPSLVREYGEFTPRARFEELRSVILSLGCKVEPDDLSGDVHRYRVLGSGVRIFVIDDPDPFGDGDHDVDDPEVHQAGDVWALSVSLPGGGGISAASGMVRPGDGAHGGELAPAGGGGASPVRSVG
ncbi:hypothetical protein [Streptomyces sp. NPDC002758]